MLIPQTHTRIVRAVCFAVAVVNIALSAVAFGQEEAEGDVPDLLTLEGKTVELIYADGTAEWPLKVTQIQEGKTPGSLKYIKVQFKQEKRQRKVNANKIGEIILDHQDQADYEHLDVIFDKAKRGLVHSPEKRQQRLAHRAKVSERLKGLRKRLWQPISAQEEEKFLTRQKELIEKTESHFSNIKFRVVETEYFFFCTDLTSEQVDGYLASLDAMYRELCLAFGIPPARKIWVGKCVVFAFSRKSDFREFEASIMGNEDAQGQGICHQSSNGPVIFAGYRGDSDSYFGKVMVHETAHGFVHRYLSSARAPSWLNEGMSDWIANAIMKTDAVPRRQIQSANLVKKTGTWGDFLTASRIEFDHYGSASTLVEMLLRRDKGGQFRQFFRGIKEGIAPEESLKDNFGLSYQDLTILYAEQIARMPERLPRSR